jgi:tetratricopeptide (TPR) repeat protein
LNPDDVEVSRTYAAYLASMGRLDESVFWQQHACDLQPLSFDLNAVLVMRLFIARRYEEAIQQAHKALQMISASRTQYYEWRCYEQGHMFEEAYRVLQELMAAEKDKATAAIVARAYAASGYEKARTVYLKRRLKDLEKRSQQERFNPLDAAITFKTDRLSEALRLVLQSGPGN